MTAKPALRTHSKREVRKTSLYKGKILTFMLIRCQKVLSLKPWTDMQEILVQFLAEMSDGRIRSHLTTPIPAFRRRFFGKFMRCNSNKLSIDVQFSSNFSVVRLRLNLYLEPTIDQHCNIKNKTKKQLQ